MISGIVFILFVFCLALVNGFIIIGLHGAFQYEEIEGRPVDKMILWRVRFWLSKKLDYFWMKPLTDCPQCMTSFHSTYIYFPVMLHFLNPGTALLVYFLYIPFLSGLISKLQSW